MLLSTIFQLYRGGDLQLSVQSMSITTNVVSSNSIHDEVYSIQHHVIKFVSDLRQVGGFLSLLRQLQTILNEYPDDTQILRVSYYV
jgi:hypothetical protein